ncbi:arsenate reductase ArsC [bacterium]|nr:arsenate reductase ArsC [bacterium]
MSDKPKVIVVCTGNTMRSQMAEGLLRYDLGDKIEVFSAGTHPSHAVHPLTIAAMQDIGIDISHHKSEGIDRYADIHMDLAITVCDDAHEICPLFPNANKTVHQGYPDPVSPLPGMSIEDTFSYIRDRMRVEIREIVERELNLKQ